MLKPLLIGTVGLCLLATPAIAFRPGDNWAPGAPGYGPPGGNRDPDAIRCQNRRATGSRARTVRICLTNAQWAEIRDEGNRDADTLIGGQRNGCQNPGASGAVNSPC